MSQSYETTGTIHSIGEVQEVGSNGFTKRLFVILLTGDGENEKYPNHVQFELIKDKTALMDQYQVGNEVKVTFNIEGRLWAGNGEGEKVFNTNKAWQVDLVNIGQEQAAPQPNAYDAPGTGAPEQTFDAILADYKAATVEVQGQMWAVMSPANQAALSAALS